LASGAVVACVLPETVLNGSHHEPFRSAGYLSASRAVAFVPKEIWKVASNTFKNEAIVLFGRKARAKALPVKFPGREVGRSIDLNTTFHVVWSGGKSAWTAAPHLAPTREVKVEDSVGPLFREGADVMPRGIVFHAATKVGSSWKLGHIVPGSPFYFLRSDGKKLADFGLTASGVSDQVMFDVLLSKHLAPWELAPGSKALLPFRWDYRWEANTGSGVAALGSSTAAAVKAALAANDETINDFFARVDTDRKKLTTQHWKADTWVVFASAGGKLPCAAYVRGGQIPCSKTIVDQTLYWGVVQSEDEAIYIAALINSPAVIDVIVSHQPRGAFGERHIHKLAFDRTPVFDPASPEHAAVVDAARALLNQWAIRRVDGDIFPLLSPEVHLITRRKKIRSALEALPAWGAYDVATRAVYHV